MKSFNVWSVAEKHARKERKVVVCLLAAQEEEEGMSVMHGQTPYMGNSPVLSAVLLFCLKPVCL